MESLIGPFQSSPFSIIPKPAKLNKFRILQNYSFPYKPSLAFPNPSINPSINSDDFPQPRALCPLLVYYFTSCLQVHNLPQGMSPKPTTPFPSTCPNGPLQSLNLTTTVLQLISPSVLVFPPVLGHTGKFDRLVLISFILIDWPALRMGQ